MIDDDIKALREALAAGPTPGRGRTGDGADAAGPYRQCEAGAEVGAAVGGGVMDGSVEPTVMRYWQASSADDGMRNVERADTEGGATDAAPDVRLWKTASDGRRLLVELNRSSYPDDDAFQAAIDFHLGRGCEDSYSGT